MNIHDDKRYGPRPKNYKARNTAKPSRTRTGQIYPGGRPMRRALAALARSMSFYEGAGKRSKGGQNGFTKPGSMQGK